MRDGLFIPIDLICMGRKISASAAPGEGGGPEGWASNIGVGGGSGRRF